ncbi:MAG: peptide chain release factor N(5)-glutamine methyltransferase [Planctomycetaceae bacterium]|nr:peptide chain release factor N(5)-glutamine methyltransferase [Planctomycetaceae bacterium]
MNPAAHSADHPDSGGGARGGSSGGARGGELPPRTARELLERARAFLARKGLAEGRLEAELLVAHALGLERLRLFVELDRPVMAAEVTAARDLLVRRANREPVAYLTGKREFYGRPFRVGPGVLVPRPETELLVDLARAWAKGRLFPAGGPRVLDVGTGSGCLAVTVALELPGARVVAVDVSAAALDVARANGAALGAEVEWREEDAYAALVPGTRLSEWAAGEALDLVVSNPPYVDPKSRAELPEDVREHEPELALFAPADEPDAWAQRLALGVAPRLAPGGRLFVELGFDQAPRIDRWLGTRGFDAERKSPRGFRAGFERDLAGHQRVFWLAAPE